MSETSVKLRHCCSIQEKNLCISPIIDTATIPLAHSVTDDFLDHMTVRTPDMKELQRFPTWCLARRKIPHRWRNHINLSSNAYLFFQRTHDCDTHL